MVKKIESMKIYTPKSVTLLILVFLPRRKIMLKDFLGILPHIFNNMHMYIFFFHF